MNLPQYIDSFLKSAASIALEFKLIHQADDFLEWKLSIVDPNAKALSFDLFFNSRGEISSLQIPGIELPWLNIAEGYSSNDIQAVAMAIFSGNYKTGKTLFTRQPTILFDSSMGGVRGVLKDIEIDKRLNIPYERRSRNG